MSTSLLPVQQHCLTAAWVLKTLLNCLYAEIYIYIYISPQWTNFNESQSVTHIYDFFLKKELFVNESIWWINSTCIVSVFNADIIRSYKHRYKTCTDNIIWHWRKQRLAQFLKLFLQYFCHHTSPQWILDRLREAWPFSDNLVQKKRGEWKLINTAVMALCERSWELVIFYAN